MTTFRLNHPLVVLLLTLCALLLTDPAMATEPPPDAGAEAPSASGEKSPMSAIGKNINHLMQWIGNSMVGRNFSDSVKEAAIGMSSTGAVQNYAYALAAILSLASLIWNVMLAMLSRKSVVTAVFEVLLFSSIAVLLIANYGVFVNQIWSLAFGLMDALGLHFGLLNEFFSALFYPIGGSVKGMFGGSIWDVIRGIFASFANALLTCVIVIFMLFAAFKIVGALIIGPIYFGVGVVVGPLMIATLVTDYTRQWFNQWLNFLVGSAFLTGMTLIVLKLLTEVFQGTVGRMTAGENSILVTVGLVFLAATVGKLFESVPAMADALFPGRTGAGAAINHGGISPIRPVANAAGVGPTTAAKIMAGVAQGGPAGAIKAFAQVALNTKSAVRGLASGTANSAQRLSKTDAGKFAGSMGSTFANNFKRGAGMSAGDKTSEASQVGLKAAQNLHGGAAGSSAGQAVGAKTQAQSNQAMGPNSQSNPNVSASTANQKQSFIARMKKALGFGKSDKNQWGLN